MVTNDKDELYKQKTATEYFPVIWNKSGFSMGLYIKGKGSLSIQLSREPHSMLSSKSKPISSLYSLTLDFDEKKLLFRDEVNQNIISKKVSSDLVLSEDTLSVYWFEMRCSKKLKGKSHHDYNCFLCLGKSGEKNPLIEVNIGNPFKVLQIHPTFVSFLPVSNKTSIQLSFDCSREFGDVCAHTNECKKTNDNLMCGNAIKQHDLHGINGVKTFEEDRCRCRGRNMRWVAEMKNCVEA